MCYSDLYHLLKHHHRPSTPLHCAPIPEAPQDPKDLLLVPLKPFVVMFKVTGVYLLFCFFNISFCSGLRIRVVLDTWLDFDQHVQNRDSESDALLTIAMFRLCFRRSRTNPLGVIFMPLKFQFKTQGSVYSSGPFPFLFEMIFFCIKASFWRRAALFQRQQRAHARPQTPQISASAITGSLLQTY